MNGKISRLPNSIREQLNRRLDDAEPHPRLLAWLNSLPEVQSFLAAECHGQPISKQNLYQWTQHGFRAWKLRQNALAFATADDAETPLPDSASAPGLTDKLVHWLALRFAATAHTLVPADDDPDSELRRLRHLTADIVALRRGHFYSRRLTLEEQRLAVRAAESDASREEEFWEWTKRPDIRKQLEAEIDEHRAWLKTLRAQIPELAAYLPPEPPEPQPQPDESAVPAALI